MTETAHAAESGEGDDYATWDGPYVLGALGRAERLEYELHLTRCARCRAAVAELAGLPGLLGQVDTGVAMSLVDPVPEQAAPGPRADADSSIEPPVSLARLAERTRRQRRRGRLLAVTGAVAAAAAAVAIAIPVTASLSARTEAPTTAEVVAERSMDAVVPSPITASFRLVAVPEGTRVEMSCSYAPSNTQYTWQGSMWVVHADGTQSMIAQWTARPGDTVTPDGTTAVPPGQVRSVEIRSAATNQVMLSSTL
ncbi:zf-HC2 domain-containing protein [Nocardia blacklockiae]|uniref:zf-HC2 domain-containing protein n=1 Tax=Nocardia blacklockiae TaxID=480036 RepID=UPI001894A052|nr:zf-HC2 domain-containing protein [Nocardia blacklockiae]MBF6176204.1 zf-HC2 domain-containing protein [Nocardia blacklockiae]